MNLPSYLSDGMFLFLLSVLIVAVVSLVIFLLRDR